jgi:hypothetical protein
MVSSWWGEVPEVPGDVPKDDVPKKEPPFPAAFEVDNREASNRVDRSHSVSKRGRL